jgi:hypothetical protein
MESLGRWYFVLIIVVVLVPDEGLVFCIWDGETIVHLVVRCSEATTARGFSNLSGA